MKPFLFKRLRMMGHCLEIVAVYALMPAMLLLERFYGGGPRRRAWSGRGWPRLAGSLAALALYELTRALGRGRG